MCLKVLIIFLNILCLVCLIILLIQIDQIRDKTKYPIDYTIKIYDCYNLSFNFSSINNLNNSKYYKCLQNE